MAMATAQAPSSYLSRSPNPSGLADVLNIILDKGLVIDAYVRVSLVGIELLTIDARIVIASVDTYLRFAEAVNRLDLTQTGQQQTLPGLIEELQESGANKKTKGMLEGAKESIFGSDDDDDADEDKSGNGGGRRTRQRARSSSGSRSGGSSKRSSSKS
jgi:gas vesicle structural protein